MIRGWRVDGERLVEMSRPDPVLEHDAVLIEVEAAVIGGPELAGGNRESIAGGAAVGTVARAADAAAHMVGKRVAVGPAIACGECDVCRRGAAFVCPAGQRLGVTADGCLATAVVSRARWVCALDDGLAVPGPAAALIAREAASAYALYARAGVSPGEPVIAIGADPVARLLIEIGRARGTAPIAAATADEARAAADAAGWGARPWKIFETSGDAAARALAVSLAGPGATIALLATGEAAPAPADVAAAIERDASILGVAGAHPDLLPEVAALVVRGEIDLAAAAELAPIGDGDALIERARRARSLGRALVATM